MMENDVLTMRICKGIIERNWFLHIIESVPSKKAESLKAWLAMVGRVRIWMCCAARSGCRCCERKTINRTEKGRPYGFALCLLKTETVDRHRLSS